MSMKFSGAWGQVKNFLRRAATGSLGKLGDEYANQMAEEITRKVRMHINAQDLPWEALAQGTIAKKGHDTIYIDQGAYMVNIEVEIIRSRMKTRLQVGPSKGATYRGTTYQQLAIWLEHGTKNMPARPVWGPVWDEIKADKSYSTIIDSVSFDM